MERKVQKSKNKTPNTSKGITLIALVITIIVLLILAAVAINMAINSDGLFGKANEAAEGWNTAVEEERTAMQDLLDELGIDSPGVVSAQGVTLDKTSVSVLIGKKAQLIATVIPNEATNKNVTWSSSDETKLTVDENGVVKGISEGTATITVTTESKNKIATCTVNVTSPVASYVTETSTIAGVNKTRNVPIPIGFVASQITANDQGEGAENTIAGGLVIYEIPTGAEVNWTTKKIIQNGIEKNLQEEVNQFVWIPVDDINSMVMCKRNGKATKADGTATAEGKTVCSLLQEIDGTLICTTHNSDDLAGRLYSTYIDSSGSDGIYTRKLDFSNMDQKYISYIGYREPAYQKEASKGDTCFEGSKAIKAMLRAEGKIYDGTVTYDTIMADWLALQQADYDAMAESVARYGGFYISRYEIGAGGISKKNKDVLKNNSEANNWWRMYSKLRAEGKTMIWGSQYDQVIKFIGETAQVGHNDRNLTTSLTKSGLNELDLMNNIYDLGGNLCELTAEAYDHNIRVSRGSNYYAANNGNFYPPSKRGSTHPPSTQRL